MRLASTLTVLNALISFAVAQHTEEARRLPITSAPIHEAAEEHRAENRVSPNRHSNQFLHKTRARAARAERVTSLNASLARLTADFLVPQRLWKAIGRFSIFDAEGQRRSVKAGGLSALLSQLWLPSHLQRAAFPQEHFSDFVRHLKTVEHTIGVIIDGTPTTPPALAMFDQKRGFGQPFNFTSLIDTEFKPLIQ